MTSNIKTLASLVFSLALLGALPEAVSAQTVTITSFSECQSSTFSTEQSLNCEQCIVYSDGVFEIMTPPGGNMANANTACNVSGDGASEGGDVDAQYMQYVRDNYDKTSVACTFSDNDTCPGDHVCGGDFCYAPRADSGTRLVNLASVDSVPELLEKALSLLVQVGTILLVFFLVLTGFKFVAAQGNPGAIEEARSSLTWVVIGGMLLLGAQALSMVIAAAVTSL